MEGSTGSENTGKAAGAAALVISAAKDAPTPITLRPDETREILEQTAERVTTGNGRQRSRVPDPGADANRASARPVDVALRLGPGQPRRRGLSSPAAARSRPRRRSTPPTGTRR